MKIKLLEIPKVLTQQATIASNNMSYVCECVGLVDDPVEYCTIKVLSIAIQLLLSKGEHSKNQSLLFSPSTDNLKLMSSPLCEKDLDDSEDEEEILDIEEQIGEAKNEVYYDYVNYIDNTLFSLTNYGWEFEGEYVFETGKWTGRNTIPYETYKNTRLRSYNEYFDRLCLGHDYFSTEARIFVNKRLGQFKKFCLKHKISNALTQQITAVLANILNFFGAQNNLNRIAEDGFEAVFLITDEYGYIPSNNQRAYISADIFLPIHAYNLEKLLDKAFELYPIEKEVQDEDKRKSRRKLVC